MKYPILELLKNGALSIDEIADKLNIDDIYATMSMVAELVYDNKVILKGMKTCYQPDGSAFYDALYGLRDN